MENEIKYTEAFEELQEIVTAMEYLIQHPEIKHGKIRICFTPDEEVGKGAHLFDVAKFGADWAYTMDGSQIGELEYENFNAAGAKVTITGKIVHPGYAKGKMINSMLIANEFIATLPKQEVPEKTEGYEGFFHLHDIKGNVEETVLEYIIRDHDLELFEERKKLIFVSPHKKIDLWMDRIFLSVLRHQPQYAPQIFSAFAKSLTGDEFAKFLSGEASLKMRLKVIFAMPIWPFVIALVRPERGA